MRAELVMIGTELLLGETVDSNATYLAEGIAGVGIDLYYKSTVGDNWLRIVEALTQALSRADLVITSGGLGPTMDDLTRECVAAVLRRPLVLNEQALRAIEDRFSRMRREMTKNNRKQAYLPEGATAIPNSWGTAPGIQIEAYGKTVFCLPGVPRELKGMFDTTVLPYLQEMGDGTMLVSRILSFSGIGESQLEELVKDIIASQSNPTVAPYASFGMVKLRICAKARDRKIAQGMIGPVEEEIRQRVGSWLFGTDGQTLEEVIGAELAKTGESLACAESCSGGLIASRITDIPGSSRYFDRGFVTYSNEAKVQQLGVAPETLASHGAVSEATVKEMAVGARERAGTDWGLAVTGIAGPDGGSPQKPVGLVYIAVAGSGTIKTEEHRFQGTREEIKYRVSQAGLNLLWNCLKESLKLEG